MDKAEERIIEIQRNAVLRHQAVLERGLQATETRFYMDDDVPGAWLHGVITFNCGGYEIARGRRPV